MGANWRCPVWVTSRLHGHCVDTSALRVEADVIGGKADVEIEGLIRSHRRRKPPPRRARVLVLSPSLFSAQKLWLVRHGAIPFGT